MNPHRKKELERRLSLLENGVTSAEQKMENPNIGKEAKAHLRERLARLGKERDAIKAELGLTEGKEQKLPEEVPKAEPKKGSKKKKR